MLSSGTLPRSRFGIGRSSARAGGACSRHRDVRKWRAGSRLPSPHLPRWSCRRQRLLSLPPAAAAARDRISRRHPLRTARSRPPRPPTICASAARPPTSCASSLRSGRLPTASSARGPTPPCASSRPGTASPPTESSALTPGARCSGPMARLMTRRPPSTSSRSSAPRAPRKLGSGRRSPGAARSPRSCCAPLPAPRATHRTRAAAAVAAVSNWARPSQPSTTRHLRRSTSPLRRSRIPGRCRPRAGRAGSSRRLRTTS